ARPCGLRAPNRTRSRTRRTSRSPSVFSVFPRPAWHSLPIFARISRGFGPGIRAERAPETARISYSIVQSCAKVKHLFVLFAERKGNFHLFFMQRWCYNNIVPLQ